MQGTKTIHIEESLFEDMIAHMDMLHKIVSVLFEKLSDKKLSEWVSGEFVCNYLNIAPRTLRSYQEHGIIPYAKLGKANRYKGQDVEALILNASTD